MAPSPGEHEHLGEALATMSKRQSAPAITINHTQYEADDDRLPRRPKPTTHENPPVLRSTTETQNQSWSPASVAHPKPYLHFPLDIPHPESRDAGHDSSSAVTMSPVFSAARSQSTSSCSTLPERKRPEFSRPFHSSISEHPFSVTPNAWAETISSKSIAELEALGGLEGIARGLQTDLFAGLSSESWQTDGADDVSSEGEGHGSHTSRIDVYGTNRIPLKKAKGIFELMMIALSDKVLILLCVVATISLVLGLYQTFFQPHLPGQPRIEWVDSVTIMAAVLIVVVTGAVNDYQKEKQFTRLVRKTEDRTIKAIRSGQPTEISVFDILVGDILYLSAGSLLPADGVLVTGYSIRCDESTITGESDQIKKMPLDTALLKLSVGEVAENLDPFILSGSKVLEGTGTYLVTGVGANSIHGRLKMDLTERTEPTPLQSKLSIIADKIAMAGVSVAVLLFVTLTIKIVIQLSGTGLSTVEFVQIFLRIFMVSISIVVVAVPEGLPLAVTLALAIGVTRMLKDNNLVRVLSACETMGNATTICSDKTGTLTMNKMTVTAGRIGLEGGFNDAGGVDVQIDDDLQAGREMSSSGQMTALGGLRSSLNSQVREAMVLSIAVNTTALERHEDGVPTFIGSSTETALLSFSRTWLGMQALQEQRANVSIKQMYPFDSARKYMATVTAMHNGMYRVYVKGAPEVLLRRCDRILRNTSESLGADVELTSERYQSLIRTVDTYGEQSLRTLGFAYKDISSFPPPNASTDEEELLQTITQNMTFLAVLAIQDPLRPEVRHAVAQCAAAGVSVRMVTGDNAQTALAIARECGILTDSGLIMEGPEFRKLPASEMLGILPSLQVLARSSPEDKKILVKRLKELGETVAVTGDGTNDGPALRTADVGFSMGISGTDVAQEASSIVLMDDNFSSIVKAIEWGRSINDVVKKFLHFQLTVNITAVTLTFVSAIHSDTGESILSPAQLLWVNLIMDTLAALALATDAANPSVLQRAPDTKKTPLISITGWKMIIGQAIYQLVIILILNFEGPNILRLIQPGEVATLETFVFNTFVWMQLFNLYNNRRLDNNFNVFEGVHKNLFFIGVNIVIITGQVFIVTIGGSALSTVPLSANEWIVSIALGALCMPVAVVIRLIPDDAIRHSFGLFKLRRNQARAPPHSGADSWFDSVHRVHSELATGSQTRSSRLKYLFHSIGHLWIWRKSQTVDVERAASPDERSPLLQDSASDGGSSSRKGSACASSVVMAGMVAGGVGGWPREEQPV